MTHCAIFTVLLIYFVTISFGQDRPFVETSLGKIRGHYKQSYNGRKFAAYEGIPYAKPPIGNLRFEEPIEVEPWSGVWDATMVHTCLYLNFLNLENVGSEDCLYLNVYVPEDANVQKPDLDVIVHIHGGGFTAGDPNLAGPQFLMDRNVVYVNMNYRLGALGFLSTEDDVVPGNNGLKDQVMALRWIQKHIKRFGGNPDSVTITGASAGGVATHLHYFSPLSKGLFHRGVSQGGTALVPWTIRRGPLKKAKSLGALIGCETASTKDLIKCLKRRPAQQIIRTLDDSPGVFPIVSFSPVIEKKSPRAFLSGDPYKLLKSGEVHDVPWITGSVSAEGIPGLVYINSTSFDLNSDWETVLPLILSYNESIDESNKGKVAQKVKEFYLGGKDVSDENADSLVKLFGERMFYLGLEKSVRLQIKANKNPVYTYLYGYKAKSKFKEFFAPPKDYGVNHGSDSQFLYDISFGAVKLLEDRLEESDEKVKETFLDLFTSFAKDGKPTSKGVTWDLMVDESDFRYLFIHNDGINMASKREIAPSKFWESLPLREYENLVLEKDEL